MSSFDENKKNAYHDKQFPKDLKKAYLIGKELGF